MIKKLLSIACFALLAGNVNAQSFSLYYSFSAVTATPNTGPVDPTTAPSATGVNSGSWSAVGTGTSPSGSGYFSFTGWGTGATNGSNTTFTGTIDPAKYYELTLIPQSNYVVSLTNMSFGVSRSGTGIRHFSVRTNKDGYTANVPATYTALGAAATSSAAPIVSVQPGDIFFWTQDSQNTGTGASGFATNNICNVNFSGANFTNQFTPYIIRVYAWDAEGTGGTFRMDTVVVNGSATFSVGVGFPTLTHDITAKFKLYPNPTVDGVVNLEATSNSVSKVEVLNILGSVVASTTLAEEKIKLNLATLPAGTYFVRLTSGNAVTTEKLIIK
jgi:hypothetical protein